MVDDRTTRKISVELPERVRKNLYSILCAIVYEKYDRAEAFCRLALRNESVDSHQHMVKAMDETRRLRKERHAKIARENV